MIQISYIYLNRKNEFEVGELVYTPETVWEAHRDWAVDIYMRLKHIPLRISRIKQLDERGRVTKVLW